MLRPWSRAWVQTAGNGDVISRPSSDCRERAAAAGFAILSLPTLGLAYALTLPAMLAIDRLSDLASRGALSGAC